MPGPQFEIAPFVPLMNQSPQYQGRGYEIGDWTYGKPFVHDYNEGVGLKIGKFCSIADGVILMLGGEHRLDLGSTYPFNAYFPFARECPTHIRIKGDLVIGNDVWIGRDAMILSGVTIGDGACIGARALVTKDVEPYAVVGGVPAKVLKHRFDEWTIQALLKISWWSWSLEKVAEGLPLLLHDLDAFIGKYYGRD